MKRLLVMLLVLPFLVTACDVGRKLADNSVPVESDAFYVALNAYVVNAEKQDACKNLDDIFKLNELAATDSQMKLLKEVNVGRLFLDSFIAGVDVTKVQERFSDLSWEQKKANADGTYVKVLNPNTFLDYMQAVFGSCAAENGQVKFAALTLALSEVYKNFTSTIIAAAGNDGVVGALDVADVAGCAKEVDAYIKDMLPKIAAIPVGDKVINHTDAIIKDLPSCLIDAINPPKYNIQTSVNDGGYVTPNYFEGKPGFTQTFQITPWDGYTIQAVYIDGMQLTAAEMAKLMSTGWVEFQNVQTNHRVEVNFAAKQVYK